MKVIIAGSRGVFPSDALITDAIQRLETKTGREVKEIVSGGARGADHCGECYAQLHGYDVVRMDAEWNLHGKSAGHKRNEEMGVYADAAIVFWDGRSRGSKGMIDIMQRLGKPLVVWCVDSALQVPKAPTGG